MKVLKAGYEILTPISEGGIKELQQIERIARVCYKSEDKITEDGESAKKMVKNLIDRGHEAMLEHSQLSVLFTVDRGVTHELVRHRIASFAQESTRYCNYSKDKFDNEISFIDIKNGMYLDATCDNLNPKAFSDIYSIWVEALEFAERQYLKLIELGAPAQIARSVLPNSTKSNITLTANYREWRNFFKLRAEAHAHPQMREVTYPLLLELKRNIPVIFDDIKLSGYGVGTIYHQKEEQDG